MRHLLSERLNALFTKNKEEKKERWKEIFFTFSFVYNSIRAELFVNEIFRIGFEKNR